MRVGIDIHGVLDEYPSVFGKLSRLLIKNGHKVYILTGQKRDKVMQTIYDSDASFTDIYSVLDYHIDKGTEIWEEENSLWMDDNIWVRTKGEFARELKLDYHFDDSVEYAQFFPNECQYVLVNGETMLTNVLEIMIELAAIK